MGMFVRWRSNLNSLPISTPIFSLLQESLPLREWWQEPRWKFSRGWWSNVTWVYIHMLHFQFRMTCRLVVFKLFYFHPYLGKISNMTIIFFRWVETNHQPAWDDLGFFEEIPQNRPASKREPLRMAREVMMMLHWSVVLCFTAGYWRVAAPSLFKESWLIQKYFQNMKLNLILIRFNHIDDNNNNSLVFSIGRSTRPFIFKGQSFWS